MEITELKKNKRTKTYDFFLCKFIDGSYIFKIHSNRCDRIWNCMKYPTSSMLKNILFLDDFGEYLLYKSGMRGRLGSYRGKDFLYLLNIKRIE